MERPNPSDIHLKPIQLHRLLIVPHDINIGEVLNQLIAQFIKLLPKVLVVTVEQKP